jgi:tetratricopeptide (TPR) repeat protein
MGPAVTVFCALVFGLIAYSTLIPNWIRVFFGLQSFITLIDALRYLIPSNRPILMANDGITYNDGEVLRNLFNHKRLNSKFKEVEIATDQKDYEQAGDLLMAAIPKANNKTGLYRYAASVFTEGKHYEKAIAAYAGLEKEGGMDANDFNNAGLIFAYLLQYENALAYFEKAVALQMDHSLALTNRAFTHLVMEHYELAHGMFDQLFQKDPENAYLLTNRGLAAAKNGQPVDGLQDMERALQMNPEEPYAHRNLGIYFLDQGSGVEALKYLKMAHKINPQTHLIDALLEKAAAA